MLRSVGGQPGEFRGGLPLEEDFLERGVPGTTDHAAEDPVQGTVGVPGSGRGRSDEFPGHGQSVEMVGHNAIVGKRVEDVRGEGEQANRPDIGPAVEIVQDPTHVEHDGGAGPADR